MRLFVPALLLLTTACSSSSSLDDAENHADDACNPVAQTGCAADEKCTWSTYMEEPALGKTECVPAGTVQAGGACTEGVSPGVGDRYDDCAKGLYCTSGVCTEICTQADASSCGSEGVCMI